MHPPFFLPTALVGQIDEIQEKFQKWGKFLYEAGSSFIVNWKSQDIVRKVEKTPKIDQCCAVEADAAPHRSFIFT